MTCVKKCKHGDQPHKLVYNTCTKLKKGRKKIPKTENPKKVPDVFKNANGGMDDINRQLARSGVSDNLNESF